MQFNEEQQLRRAFHSLEWEPGDLTTSEIERILTDALADLWRDSYRQGNPGAQRNIFRERVLNAIKCATGDRGVF